MRNPTGLTLSAAVVVALAEQPATWRYGYELCQQLDLKAGSVYPILMRLADRGLLETTWESAAPAGRPPRHLYRLTGPGRVLAAELAAAPSAPAKAARAAGRVGRRPRLEAVAGAAGRSFRSGLWACAWATVLGALLVIVARLAEALRWYQQGRGLLLDGEGGLGVGANLGNAIWWPLVVLVLWALPLGGLGAAAGSARARRRRAREHADLTPTA